VSLYKVEDTWYVYLTPPKGGKRIRRSTGTSDKKEAQRIHDELKADLWKRKVSGSYLSDALTRWLKQRPRTRNEKNAIKQFLQLYPDRPIDEITGPDIAEALEDKSAATANRTITIVRAALNLEHEAQKIGKPPKIPTRSSNNGRLRWLTRTEWDKLYKELPAHIKPMAKFAVSTGLRQANVLALRWANIDMGRRVMWVEAIRAKAKKAIGIPLSDEAMEALAAVHGDHDDYVFTYREKPVASVKTAFGKALARAGLGQWVLANNPKDENDKVFEPDTTWHDLRHTWASWHVQAGTPLAVLKELGGWATMDMVLRYAHLAPDHLASWANNATKYAIGNQQTQTALVAQWIEQPPPKG